MNGTIPLTEQELRAVREARRTRVLRDFENLGLSERYLEVFEANPSAELPYHGNEHQLAVALLAYRGAFCYRLSQDSKRSLLLAGLFHDYGYELDASEEANLASAVGVAKTILDELNPELSEHVLSLILDTEFPHRHPGSMDAALLQDADLLMITQPDYDEFLRGLAAEHPDWAPDPEFPGSDALNTLWAQRVYATALESRRSGRVIRDALQAVSVGNAFHAQTLSSRGFLVDSTIADGLEALWAAGYETVFSCGGDRDGELTPSWTEPMSGYIAFTSVSQPQRRKLQSAAGAIGTELEFRVNDSGIRAAIIRFQGVEVERFLTALLGPR